VALGVEGSIRSEGGLRDLGDVTRWRAGLDQRSDGESDARTKERRQYHKGPYVTRRSEAMHEVIYIACDLRGEAAAVRVGAGLQTSDVHVYAKGIVVVVLNREQGLVGIVADGRRGGGCCWRLVMEHN